MQNKRVFWYCSKDTSHVVGELRNVALMDGSGHVTVLMLYEQAVMVSPEDVPPLRADKVFHAEGLRCTICGREFDWYPSLPSLMRLLNRYEKHEEKTL